MKSKKWSELILCSPDPEISWRFSIRAPVYWDQKFRVPTALRYPLSVDPSNKRDDHFLNSFIDFHFLHHNDNNLPDAKSNVWNLLERVDNGRVGARSHFQVENIDIQNTRSFLAWYMFSIACVFLAPIVSYPYIHFTRWEKGLFTCIAISSPHLIFSRTSYISSIISSW